MEKEKKLVTLSMVVLFFSLIVVYSLFYQIKGEKLIQILRAASATSASQESKQESGGQEDLHIDLLSGDTQATWTLEWDSFSDISTWSDAQQVETGWIQTASPANHLSFEGEGPSILSGTDLYFGAVESVELLGLKPEYILKDNKGFYYAKLSKKPDLKQTVQDLDGNIYTMSSEAEILKNKLFGESISFVNIPEYKNKIVIMLLTVDDQYWLIQMDYKKYHHEKSYLKKLFIS